MSDPTEEEVWILELEANAGRLHSVAREFQKIEFTYENEQFRMVLREVIILYLWNFLQARSRLMPAPGFRKLDEYLAPLIKPIVNVCDSIAQLRNGYIAHIQKKSRPFKVRIQEIYDKYNLSTNEGYWCMLAEMAYYYAKYVVKCRSAAHRRACGKYVAMAPATLRRGTIKMCNFIDIVREAVRKTDERLAAQGGGLRGDKA